MRITSKGQVTIPQAIREQAGLLPGCEVEFLARRRHVRIVPTKSRKGLGRGERIVQHLRGRGSLGLSTDEIMALTRVDD